MNFLSRIESGERDFDRYMANQTFYVDPFKWIGKWMLGMLVYLAILGIPLALYFWYHYFFIPWRDKW